MTFQEEADYAEWINRRDARWTNLIGAATANRFGYGNGVEVRAEIAVQAEIANGFAR